MTIIERIEKKTSALKVEELAQMLEVTPQHLYRLIARGLIPSLRIAGAVRLDPQEVGGWLRNRAGRSGKKSSLRAA